MKDISYEDLKFIIDSSKSMADAARKLNINYKAFRKKTKNLGLFVPNQSRKGVKRECYENNKNRFLLDDILDGKHPFYGSSKLRIRLISSGIKEDMCESCGLVYWKGEKISLHLDHIDGDHTNHKLNNLRILCPNCHSQTDTYCAKNKNAIGYTKIEILKAIKESKSYTDVKKKIGLGISGSNSTIKNIMILYDLSFGDDKIDAILLNECDKDKKIDSIIKLYVDRKTNICSCGKEIHSSAKNCEECSNKLQRKVERPSHEQLLREVKETSYLSVGRKYGVSDNAIRKWIRYYEKHEEM